MEDKHREFAAKLFKCSEESVTPEQRRVAKCWAHAIDYSADVLRLYNEVKYADKS